tara:strand:- start:235 stop:762 length:528 start_codon:yes stop_codon:yes gene_type:complete
MIRNIRLAGLFLLFFLINNPIQANEKIMFIDLDFVYFNSIAGKQINDQIKKKSKSFNNNLKEKQKKIKNKKEKLLSQKNVLSENEYREKVIELEATVSTHNKEISNKNNELQKLKNKAKFEFLTQLEGILQQYVKENSIQMIINKKDILIGKNELDATKDILVLFNKNIKKIKVQ